MYGYRRGTTVIRKPPTFLESLLSGLGYGVTQAMQRAMAEKERKRGITRGVLESVLQGEVSPELLATDLGQSYQKHLGIEKEPVAKKITQMGLEEFRPKKTEFMPSGAAVTMPGVAPTEIPFAIYRGRQEKAKEIQEQTEMQKELFEYEAREIIKRRVERSFRMPLNKRIEIAMDEYEKAIRKGIAIQNVTLRDPDTGINIDFQTYIEREQKKKTDQIANTKTGITYLKEELKYHSLLMDSENFLRRFASDKGIMPEFSKLAQEILRGIGKKSLSPEEAKTYARRVIPIINRKIETQHKILRKQKFVAQDSDITLPFLKQFKVDEALNPEKYAGEFEVIKMYQDLVNRTNTSAIETKKPEPPPPLDLKDTRSTVNIPLVDAEPTEERIIAVMQEIKGGGWINPETNLPYTEEQARELAKSYLKKK